LGRRQCPLRRQWHTESPSWKQHTCAFDPLRRIQPDASRILFVTALPCVGRRKRRHRTRFEDCPMSRFWDVEHRRLVATTITEGDRPVLPSLTYSSLVGGRAANEARQ